METGLHLAFDGGEILTAQRPSQTASGKNFQGNLMIQPHSLKNIATLVLNYVTKFHCLGKQCPNTCCAGWHVAIDRKICNLYQSIGIKILKNQFPLYRVQKAEQ